MSVHTHHSNPTCQDCGERHSRGAMLDCVDVLKDQKAELEAERDRLAGERDGYKKALETIDQMDFGHPGITARQALAAYDGEGEK